MTGVQVRERVPDWVVRRADQIELVDSSPEQLRRQMAHGNIYPQERVPQALAIFRTDSPSARRSAPDSSAKDDCNDDGGVRSGICLR